jgi:hypothetical protein
MTKGHFWYVLGCYLFLVLLAGLFQWLVTSPAPVEHTGVNLAGLSSHFGEKLMDAMWVVLSWCMYLRIKEEENQLLESEAATGAKA